MVWVRLPVYFYKRNETYYFSRSIPSDLQHRFNKRKIEVSLRTKSEAKAAKSAAALSDRLERYWDSLRMEMIYSKELGLNMETLNAYYYTAISQEEAAEQRLHPQLPGKQTLVPRIDRHCFEAIIRNDALIFQLDHVISANLAH